MRYRLVLLLLRLSSLLLYAAAAAAAESPPPAPPPEPEVEVDVLRLVACLVPVLVAGMLANLMFALNYGGKVRLKTAWSTKRLQIPTDVSSQTEASAEAPAPDSGAGPSGLPPRPQSQMDSGRSSSR
jgi:hypothetical protein